MAFSVGVLAFRVVELSGDGSVVVDVAVGSVGYAIVLKGEADAFVVERLG